MNGKTDPVGVAILRTVDDCVIVFDDCGQIILEKKLYGSAVDTVRNHDIWVLVDHDAFPGPPGRNYVNLHMAETEGFDLC